MGATIPVRIQPGSIDHVPFPTVVPCLGASSALRSKARCRRSLSYSVEPQARPVINSSRRCRRFEDQSTPHLHSQPCGGKRIRRPPMLRFPAVQTQCRFRAYLGAPTVRTPTDKGTQVEALNTSTSRKPYHWKETALLAFGITGKQHTTAIDQSTNSVSAAVYNLGPDGCLQKKGFSSSDSKYLRNNVLSPFCALSDWSYTRKSSAFYSATKGGCFLPPPPKRPVPPSGPSKKHNFVPKLRFIPATVVYGSKRHDPFGMNPLHN
ncbi:hypothetical protein KY289_008228 [Solanum tuberosum]|nr:hypothetical protein KY289_008228 [Solanum tuberosum]